MKRSRLSKNAGKPHKSRMDKWKIIWTERRYAIIDAVNKEDAWDKSDDLPEGTLYDIHVEDVTQVLGKKRGSPSWDLGVI